MCVFAPPHDAFTLAHGALASPHQFHLAGTLLTWKKPENQTALVREGWLASCPSCQLRLGHTWMSNILKRPFCCYIDMTLPTRGSPLPLKQAIVLSVFEWWFPWLPAKQGNGITWQALVAREVSRKTAMHADQLGPCQNARRAYDDDMTWCL